MNGQPNGGARPAQPASVLMPASAMARPDQRVARQRRCLVSVARPGNQVDWFRVLPRHRVTVDALPADAIIGLLEDDVVIWCHQGANVPGAGPLRLVRIAPAEVITVEIPLAWPQVSADWEIHAFRQSVCVEGPAEMLPGRVVVTRDELLQRRQLTIGDLRLPLYCETIGVPLTEEIATVSKKDRELCAGALIGRGALPLTEYQPAWRSAL